MKTVKPISVLLADDHAAVRHSLGALLEADGHFFVVGEAENGREAVTLARTCSPDVILMDISMPVLNGLEATRQIIAAEPTTKVIILSAYHDEAYVERARAVGAAGFLTKQKAASTLTSTIRKIFLGRSSFALGGQSSRAPDKAAPALLASSVRLKII